MQTITTAAGQIISYHERGSGPALVLIHAFPLDATLWTPQLESLCEQFRVVAPDLPGFGGSPAAAWTIDSVAKVIAEFLDALAITEPIALGGLSMGGYIAMAFARQFPQKLRALILADTRAESDDAAAKEGRAKMIALAEGKGSDAVAEAMLPKMLGKTTQETRLLVVEAVRTMIERQHAASVVNALEALRNRPHATAGLRLVTVPTLVIVGAEDVITPPAMAQAIAERVPGAKLEEIAGAGHLSNLESPQAFNHAITTFLNQ